MPAGSAMTQLELRDHAQEILLAVAKDLSTPQTPEAQTAKSMGLAPPSIDALETAAQTHGLLRAHSGFDIKQMASEYRALRASVLRLWTAACQPEPPDLEDMIRFNEAIDQALAESIVFFSDKVDEARNLVLGMLGHGLRFDVRNTGPAIDQPTLQRLFEPLERGHRQDNKYDSDAGLGLGLYIAREITKAHGGEIEARSEGREVVFSVRLPRRQPA